MASDQEICDAVLDSCQAQDDAIINGGDDDVDDDACPIDSRPTRREVLQAALLITQHTNCVDDPLARKLEGLLGSFTRQMHLEESRNMVSSHLTDYFTRK